MQETYEQYERVPPLLITLSIALQHFKCTSDLVPSRRLDRQDDLQQPNAPAARATRAGQRHGLRAYFQIRPIEFSSVGNEFIRKWELGDSCADGSRKEGGACA